MKFILLMISITWVLNSDLVASELHQHETQLIKAPESLSQKRQDKSFMGLTSDHLFSRHLPSVMQTSILAKQLMNGMNQGTRMIRQVLKRPKMILVPKVKKLTTFRSLPMTAAANHHRFQIKNNFAKFHKKPIQVPVKEEVIHHHTYSEEHIHIDEEEDNQPEVKKYEEPLKKQSNEQKNRYLKEIEMREEKKVEAAMGGSQMTGGHSSEIIHGTPYYFEDDWKPIEKPKPASKLNTFVMDQPIAKQVHHHKHIIELEFENKPQSAPEMNPPPQEHSHIKPASYSIINFHNPPNAKKEEPAKEFSILKAETVNPDYFYSKKLNNPDYLQASPSNTVQKKTKRANEFTTHYPLVTTTQRYRAAPTYSFRINPIEIPSVSSPTASGKIESKRPIMPAITERKKHKNLVAQTMNRGAIKFDKSEPN